MRLMRELRFHAGEPAATGPSLNSWAGAPGGTGHAPYRALRAMVEGPIDPKTGYLCDIKALDALMRQVVVPLLGGKRDADDEAAAPFLRLPQAFSDMAARCPSPATLQSLELCVSPQTSYSIEAGEPEMIRLTREYEFSAAHRLFSPTLSDEENRRLFGKCSHPHGHGHNYVVAVTLRGSVSNAAGRLMSVDDLDGIVRERVIEPFDHRNLNVEIPEFTDVNPSVENIARVIWARLVDALKPGLLAAVRVWETPKTYAEYTGEA